MSTTCTLPGERYYYHFEESDESAGEIETCENKPPASLKNYEREASKGDPGFWRRQFGDVVTSKQRKWDWMFGVFMPMICFYFDPGVFRTWGGDFGRDGLLDTYQLPAYILAYSAIMAQAAWLLWGEWLGRFRIAIGLILATAAVASFIIGLILFPFSMLGLLVAIGVLGFTPFFTAIIYWRNAVRAIRPPSTGD